MHISVITLVKHSVEGHGEAVRLLYSFLILILAVFLLPFSIIIQMFPLLLFLCVSGHWFFWTTHLILNRSFLFFFSCFKNRRQWQYLLASGTPGMERRTNEAWWYQQVLLLCSDTSATETWLKPGSSSDECYWCYGWNSCFMNFCNRDVTKL